VSVVQLGSWSGAYIQKRKGHRRFGTADSSVSFASLRRVPWENWRCKRCNNTLFNAVMSSVCSAISWSGAYIQKRKGHRRFGTADSSALFSSCADHSHRFFISNRTHKSKTNSLKRTSKLHIQYPTI